tara:strand:+ start:5192 stop:7270 length:2079 start_codon:yes stop_codon:yes gene_type:complete
MSKSRNIADIGSHDVISTTATGVDITGTVTSDGLIVDGDLAVSSANSRIRLFETDTTDLNTQLQNSSGDFNIARLDDDAGGSTVQFNIDHATGNVSIPNGDLDITGGFTATDGSTITTADNTTQLELISTDADASVGPVLSLWRNSASPVNNDDVGNIVFNAENDAGQKVIYADILCELGEVTDGIEDASLALRTITAGSLERRLQIKGTELVINEGSEDSDFRVESDTETHALFVQGSDGFVGISNSSPATALDVTGTITADGLTVDGDATFNGNQPLTVNSTGNNQIRLQGNGTAFGQAYGATGIDWGFTDDTGSLDRLVITDTGNVRIGDSVAAATITGLTQTNLVVGSATGGEIVTYRNDNGVVADDFVGAFLFGNDDNNAGEDHFAGMWALSASTNGIMDLHWAAGAVNYEAGTPQMTLLSTGNLGVGATTPSSTFRTSIYGDGETVIGGVEFRNATGGGNTFTIGHSSATSASATLNVVDAANLIFMTDDTERGRFTSNGDLTIGTSAIVSDSGIRLYKTGQIYTHIDGTASTDQMRFYRDSADVGSITTTGTATAFVTSSDYRLKTNVEPMVGSSARVQALKPVNFEWISSGERVDGFLAHEAQAVVPESVKGTKDAMRDEEYEVTPAVLDDDGNEATAAVMGTRNVPDMQGIDQSKLVPLLTAALQEALTEITALKVRVTALEE